MEQFNALREAILALTPDAEKAFVKNNKAAATRLRRGLSNIQKQAKELRQISLTIGQSETEKTAA